MTLDAEGFKDRVRESRAPVPDRRFELRDVLEVDERVVVTWQWKGTHLGDIAGFPPSGRELSLSGATVYYFDGGRISGHWQIADRPSIYRQLLQASTR